MRDGRPSKPPSPETLWRRAYHEAMFARRLVGVQPDLFGACGKDATLTPAQLAQLRTAADEARAEALARYRAGQTDITVERRNKLVEDQPSTKIGVPPAG